MSTQSTSQNTLSAPRQPIVIDLTLDSDSDEEAGPVRAPLIPDSDSEDRNDSLEIIPKRTSSSTPATSSSDEELEEEKDQRASIKKPGPPLVKEEPDQEELPNDDGTSGDWKVKEVEVDALEDDAPIDLETAYGQLDDLEISFVEHKSSFVTPDSFVFQSFDSSTLSPVHANYDFLSYEDFLGHLLGKIDAVESGGNEFIRKERKGLIRAVNDELSRLDSMREKAWEEQMQAKEAREEERQREQAEATPAEEVVEEIVKERGEEVANEVANEAQPVSDTEKNDNIVERHHEDDVEADNEDAAAVKPVSPRTPRPYSNSRRRNSSFSDPHSPIDSVKEHVAARVQEEREERVVPLPVDRQELQVLPEKAPEVVKPEKVNDNMEEGQALKVFRKELGEANIEVDEEELEAVPAPPDLVCKLLPHQVNSLRWLMKRESGKRFEHGGLLADDMGLGKTVQMIAVMLSNQLDPENTFECIPTTLVVAPLALLKQWEIEIEQKVGNKRFDVLVYNAPQRFRKQLYKKLHEYAVVITNYETVLLEKNEGTGLFGPTQKPFHRIILDEAHRIKNSTTKTAKACCEVKARFRWALTGTPIQNEVNDMFSIFKFLGKEVVPRNLWEKSTFDTSIGKPIKGKQKVAGFERLKSVTDVVMKRRTKTTTVNGKPILRLPKRIINVVRTSFINPQEAEFYDSIEKQLLSAMKHFSQGKDSDYSNVLVRITRMRQAVLHPALVTKKRITAFKDVLDPSSTDDDDKIESEEAVKDTVNDKECIVCGDSVKSKGADYCQPCADARDRVEDFDLKPSTKIIKTMELLQQIRDESKGLDENGKAIPKKKVIIFSQFTSMLMLLEGYLKAKNYKYVKYWGSISIDKRNDSIEKLTKDPETTVILVSIMAGAVGLNLNMCSRVIFIDLWWNPAVEAQAFDRAHRYGQKEDVQIYKIIIENTVEDRILKIQASKADVAAAALDGGSITKVELTQTEKNFLLGKKVGKFD